MMKKIVRKLKKAFKKFKSVSKTSYYCRFFYKKKLNEKSAIFESRNGLDVAGNIFYLLKELSEGNYGINKIYLSVCEQTVSKAQFLILRYNLKNVKLVKQGSRKYFKILATVKYIFTDTSLTRAYVKKDGQIYINTWHGTPLKKMGKYNLSEVYSMGNIQRNLLFSDYLVYPNDYMREKMLESYNIDTMYKGEILCAGYPRNSIFFENNNEAAIKKEFELEDKEIFVYMPTWKPENMGATKRESLEALNETLAEVDNLLSDNQVMYLKLHPLVKADTDVSDFDHIRAFPDNIEAYEFLSCADALITDYSSVFFDFAGSRKKIVLFTPDEENYDNERGFYFPLSELPFTKTKTAQELIAALNSKKDYDDTEFVNKFCTYDCKESAKNILSHVLMGKDTCKIYKLPKSEKTKAAFYCGALLQNGLTASFRNLLGMIDLDKRDYYFIFKQSAFKNHSERLDILDERIKKYSISDSINPTFLESFAFVLYYRFNIYNAFVKKYSERAYKRDFKKHFTSFDPEYVINFSGYDKYIIKLLNQFDANKTIFVHSDMVNEIKTRHNQHEHTLKEAYREYDNVAVVTKAMIEPTFEISEKRENISVVGNFFNYEKIIDNSKKKIEFQPDTRTSINHPGGIEGILKSDAKKFITVGRFSREKQHIMLIDAFNEYYRTNPNSYLIIIGGGGNLYNRTVAYANSKNCGQHVAIICSIANPMPILKQCDLFILPSKYEAQPIVMFEADVLGVPVICTEMEGPKDILSKNNGVMVDNSKQGILDGIEAFENGKVKTMNIDFKAYNDEVMEQFENLFKK